MPDLHPNLKLWIYAETREGVFGDGKLRLLEAIETQGSLSQAAAALKISYRKAWGDLRKAETCLGIRLIEKTRGGPGGGQTTVTPQGKALIRQYTKFQAVMRDHLATACQQFLGDFLT